MVLCVTKITWHDGPRDADGSTPDHWAVVEMTDGWYRIRVAVDDPIERAISKGHIRPGRKLAMQNARVRVAVVVRAGCADCVRVSGSCATRRGGSPRSPSMHTCG